MKRILSLLLVAVLLVSAIPTAMAYDKSSNECEDCGEYLCARCGKCPECTGVKCDCIPITSYDNGTMVEYLGQGTAQYTITVPAKLAPGGSGDVSLQGTWASNCKVKVTADTEVELTNSILATDTKTLTVSFDGIEKDGDNTTAVSATAPVSVSNIDNALFGTWSGTFNYNVEYVDGFEKGDINCDGVINEADVDAMNLVYGQTVDNTTNPALFSRADLDGDGFVNFTDYQELLSLI